MKNSKSTSDYPKVALFAVYSDSPPFFTQTLKLAENLHQALVSLSGGHFIFTGKDENRRPLQNGHEHTFIFCDANIKGRINKLFLYAPYGFDKKAQKVLHMLDGLREKHGPDIHLILLDIGAPENFFGEPFFKMAKTWVSHTPFVPTRHMRFNRNGKPRLDSYGLHQGSPEHDLCRLLRLYGLPRPVKTERMAKGMSGAREISWLKFITKREKGLGRKAANRGYGFKIEFEKEVQGPIAIGYGAHFGLGVFAPEL